MMRDGEINKQLNDIIKYDAHMNVSELSNQSLIEQRDFMKWSRDSRDNRLADKRERHNKIDFSNPNFDNLLNKIEEEVKRRNLT